MRILLVVALAAALSGCVTDSQAPVAKASLPEVKAMILASKGKMWKDPASIQSARIGTTSACIAFGDCVCVEVNAKNSYGGYTGARVSTVVYAGREITDLRTPLAAESCTIVEDFPELNGDYTPKKLATAR